MFYKKFILVRDFHFHGQVLTKGNEISVVNDIIYVNGGQITPAYYNVFHDLIQNELSTRSGEYFKEVPIPYNKA